MKKKHLCTYIPCVWVCALFFAPQAWQGDEMAEKDNLQLWGQFSSVIVFAIGAEFDQPIAAHKPNTALKTRVFFFIWLEIETNKK